MRIAAVARAFPPHYYDQATLISAFKRAWGRRHYNLDRLEQLHRHVLVGGRHLALPIEEYERLETWGQANDAWIRVGEEVGAEALARALAAAGFTVQDVGAIVFVSVTGISTPSLDARLVNRLGLPARIRRVPIFGLGCVAGAAGVSRASDLLRGSPDEVAVLLSVELCSLTLQRDDLSIPNLIATGLFGDGAAAAVIAGDGRDGPGPRILATRSVFYPGSEQVMGWSISESGFRIVLSAEVPDIVMQRLPGDVDAFLASQGLSRGDVSVWVSHPGGPKVLEAMQQALGLDEEALRWSWRSLREAGNLSSASILLVLEDVMREAAPPPGAYGLMVAMGPGFCSELVLLRWEGAPSR
ncbi:MAG: pks11 [Acidobacteria bacterium]|nr:pks11 [Acidobacteriota bacterium]